MAPPLQSTPANLTQQSDIDAPEDGAGPVRLELHNYAAAGTRQTRQPNIRPGANRDAELGQLRRRPPAAVGIVQSGRESVDRCGHCHSIITKSTYRAGCICGDEQCVCIYLVVEGSRHTLGFPFATQSLPLMAWICSTTGPASRRLPVDASSVGVTTTQRLRFMFEVSEPFHADRITG